MSNLKTLIQRNSFYLAISETTSMLILLAVTIIIAHSLGDTNYGQFAFILAFVQLFQVLADFGLGLIGIRELANHRQELKKYLNNFLGLKLIISLATFLLIIISVQFVHKPDIIKNLIYVAGSYIVLNTAAEFLRSVFKAFEKFKYETLTKISQQLILLFLILVATGKPSLSSFIWPYVISSAYGVIVTLFVIWKKFTPYTISFDKKTILYLIKEAWPLALANVFVVIYFRIDTIMLSLMKSDKETGWYNAAYLLIFSLVFFAYIIMMSVYPRLSRLVKESLIKTRQLYHQTLLLTALIGIIILSIASWLAHYFIPLLYGPEFSPAIHIFYVLTLAVFFSYLANVWLYTLNALGRQKIYTWATAIGMLLNLILNFILIPKYSYLGTAWATVITEIISGMIIFIACEKLTYAK